MLELVLYHLYPGINKVWPLSSAIPLRSSGANENAQPHMARAAVGVREFDGSLWMHSIPGFVVGRVYVEEAKFPI
jgi:hypothetical protein